MPSGLGASVLPPVLNVIRGRVDGGLVGFPGATWPSPAGLLVRGNDSDPKEQTFILGTLAGSLE